MLKKLLVFALVAVVAFAIIPRGVVAQDAAAFDCRTEEEVTVTVIAGTVGNELDAVKALADDFMALCPNITVEVTTRPQDSTETLGQYQQFFDAQSGEIDIYQIDVIWPGIFAEHLLDLNEYVSQETVDSFVASNIVNNTVDGRLVALPWFTGVGMLYYR
ncbi:MAG: extracellular solute-binding protein, partial [Anaerolineae bacterium]